MGRWVAAAAVVVLWSTSAAALDGDLAALFGPRITLDTEAVVLPTATVVASVTFWQGDAWEVAGQASGSFWWRKGPQIRFLRAGDFVLGVRARRRLGTRFSFCASAGVGPGLSASAPLYGPGRTSIFGAAQLTAGVQLNPNPRFFVEVEPLGLVDYFSASGNPLLYTAQAGAGVRW